MGAVVKERQRESKDSIMPENDVCNSLIFFNPSTAISAALRAAVLEES